MQRFVICLLLLGGLLLANGQTHYFNYKWDKRFGGEGIDAFQSFQQTSDGGYILGGYSSSDISGDKTQQRWGTSNLLSDYWIVKIDSLGNKKWDKRFGGNLDDNLIKVEQTIDGGYILGGHSNSSLSGDKSRLNWGGFDDWFVRTDSLGNKLWDERYGGTLDENFNALTLTNDKGYIFGGYSNSPISGDKTQDNWDNTHVWDDIWVVKLDSVGNKQWDKRYGGTKQDRLGCIYQTTDNSYLIVGSSSSGISGDKTQANWDTTNITFDGWVIKADTAGNKIWDKRYGGTDEDGIAAVVKSNDGGYVLGAGSYSGISGNKTESGKGYWIIKIDSIGNIVWDKTYSEATGLANFAKTTDEGYLLSGISNSDVSIDKSESNLGPTQIWIVKTDSLGNKQWDKTIFTTKYSEGYAIQTTDGCYAVGAFTSSGIGGYKSQPNWDNTEATYDYWIMKFCMDTVTDLSPTLTLGEGGIQVYPNPFTNDLTLTLTEGEGTAAHEATFTIMDMLGRVVYSKEESNLATNYTKVLDLSWLANGVYFVSISAGAKTITKKVVKE